MKTQKKAADPLRYGYNSYQGRAYLYYGEASMDNTVDIILTGEAAGHYFGLSVASAGDVNGDGEKGTDPVRRPAVALECVLEDRKARVADMTG